MRASVFFFFIATAHAQLMLPQSAVRERPLRAHRAPLAIRGGGGESPQARDVAVMLKYIHAVNIASVSITSAVGLAVGIVMHRHVLYWNLAHLGHIWCAPAIDKHFRKCDAECTSFLGRSFSCWSHCTSQRPVLTVSMERLLSFPSLVGIIKLLVCVSLIWALVSLLICIVANQMRIIGLENLRRWRPACFQAALNELPDWPQNSMNRRLQNKFGKTMFQYPHGPRFRI